MLDLLTHMAKELMQWLNFYPMYRAEFDFREPVLKANCLIFSHGELDVVWA